MTEWKGIRKTWRNLLRRRDVERAVDEEMAFHLDMAARQIAEREGLPEAEARAEAKRRFGDRAGFSSDCIRMEEAERRHRSLVDHLRDLKMDLTFGVRQIRRTPGITAAAVLCLALGIGATTAVYEIAHYALFPDTAITEPERVVRIYADIPAAVAQGVQYSPFSWPNYIDLKEQARSFEAVATGTSWPFHLAGAGEVPERVWGELVTADYFSTLGIEMALGRDFRPEEGKEIGGQAVLLLSWGCWQRRFGGDPGVLGQELLINGHALTVIGVLERDYNGPGVGMRSDLILPMGMHQVAIPGGDYRFQTRNLPWLYTVVGRLAPGVTLDQARSEVTTIAARLQAAYPGTNEDVGAHVLSEQKSRLHPMIRDRFQLIVLLNSVVVGLVLLLTCANVAGLLLARSSARRREIAIRLALGAERRRIVRQILTESLLLALVSGAVGYLLARGTAPLMQSFMPPIDMPMDLAVSSSPSAVLFVIVIALASGLMFGLTPALEASRQSLISSLTSGRVTTGRRSRRARRLMVSTQVAVASVLLILAGVSMVSLQNARRVDVGFEPEGVVEATVFLGLQGYDADRARSFHDRARQNLENIPGVTAVSAGHLSQISPSINMIGVLPEGWEGPEDPPAVMYNYIDEDYLPTLCIAVEQGRNFTLHDRDETAPVVIVNRAFADRFWPGEDPLGRTVSRRGNRMTIVGVVPTGKYFSLSEDPRFYIYFPLRTFMQTQQAYYLRVERIDESTMRAIRQVFLELDPALPAELSTLESYVDTALLVPRVMAVLVSASGLLALLLAAIGLYGLIAYSVHQRTAEIGIRVAIGAGRADIIRLVVGDGLRQTGIALIVGLGLGLLVSALTHGLLFDLAPVEPLPVTAAMSILLVTTLLATWLPARRASRIDPVRALTGE